MRKLLSPTRFNDKNPYKLHPVWPIWKSPNPAAGTKCQYHSNAQTKSLPKEAAATCFCIQNHALLWSQCFLISQFFQQREQMDERGINHSYKDMQNLLSHPPLLQGIVASRWGQSSHFFFPSSTPAFIKMKVVRLALGLLSWRCSQA